MSWKPEVQTDSSGNWCGNALCFATKEEAEQDVFDLSMRWTAVRDTRVVESTDPVNYWTPFLCRRDGRTVSIDSIPTEELSNNDKL